MADQTFSITRTRAAFKPRVAAADVPFFRDGAGNLLVGVSGEQPAAFSGSGKTAVFEPPYASLSPVDGAGALSQVDLVEAADLPEGVAMNYRIEGGFNANAVIVTWEAPDDSRVEWVALKTFTGLQLKYPLPGKRRRLVFALADEDAFAYCDKSPCEECGFRCKSGFALYALVRGIGVVRLPLDRISTSKVLGKDRPRGSAD